MVLEVGKYDYSIEILRKSWPNFVLIVIVITVIIVAELTLFRVLVLLYFVTLIRMLISGSFSLWRYVRAALTLTAIVIVLSLVYRYLGVWSAVLAFITVCLLVAGYVIYTKRKMFMHGIRQIETMIFGKPLDRDNWKKGELKKWGLKK